MARAARPTAVAKELAWADVVDRTDLPNAILEATIGGFMQPDQLDVLRRLPRPLLRGAAPRVAGAHDGDRPGHHDGPVPDVLLVDDETIAATDEFLAGDLNSALRRLVGEGRDGVLRAARARAKDAAGT